MPSRQETFDIVYKYMREQNKRSVDSTGEAVVRTEDGLKDPLGALLTDDQIDEIVSVRKNCWASEEPAKTLIKDAGHDVTLVSLMQQIHDYYDVSDWDHQFEALARTEELEVP